MAVGDIREQLLKKTVKEFSTLAKLLGVRFAESSHKADTCIVDRLLNLEQFETSQLTIQSEIPHLYTIHIFVYICIF